jgi:hypothetical protein
MFAGKVGAYPRVVNNYYRKKFKALSHWIKYVLPNIYPSLYQNCLAQTGQDLSRACGDRPIAVRAKVVAQKSAKNGEIF